MAGSVAAALVAWAAEPRLAAAMQGDDGCYLVLSGDGDRVLHASPAAKPLAAAIADDAARISVALGVAGQLRRPVLRDGAPSLMRLQFDPRRIAVPLTCLVARGRLGDGVAVHLLAFDKPVSLRSRRSRPDDVPLVAPEPEQPIQAEPESDLVAGSRFVWRSDADGRLGDTSGTSSPALRAIFAEQGWASLAASGRLLDGAALLAALDAGRTFRAVPVALALPKRRLDLDVSGAPLARAGRPFAGFGGFGLIRAVVATDATVSPINVPDLIGSAPMANDASSAQTLPSSTTDTLSENAGASFPNPAQTSDQTPDELAATATANEPPAIPTEDPAVGSSFGNAVAVPGSAPPPEPVDGSSVTQDHTALAPEAGSSDDAEPLSVNEHAAFREIAKALGARFAGDDEESVDARGDTIAGFRPQGGSVTPFPARPMEPAGDVAALLDGIPACLLVCRGETLLHANRRLLDLAGYPDLAALQVEGGLLRLFRGLPPQRHAGSVSTVAMTTRDGGSCDTEIEQARIGWLGEPADCVLVRPLPAGDTTRVTAAAAVADGFALVRATDAEAALDAVEDAVVSLDGAGRILSLNRAAAATFGCELREVVGGAFADLFPPQSSVAVRGLAQAPGSAAREVSVRTVDAAQARLLSLTAARPDGRRVAILRALAATAPIVAAKASPTEAPAGETSDFAARVGQELRAPVSGIVGSTDVILAERYGPLGDERYRGTVSDIRASGEKVLALVDDLVDLSRIEAGQRELAFGPLALNDLVAECVAELQLQAASGRVLLRTSFAADLGPILADAPSLRQAALAAIAGAIRDTAAGGQVIVSTSQAERGEIALRVRDTGPGTGARETEAGPAKAAALGLGAPLTRALVEANHGRFRVSNRQGEGTLVEMLFSIRQAALRA